MRAISLSYSHFCRFSCNRPEYITDVKNGFSGACHRAGITDFRFHDLRHTFAAYAVQAGVSLMEVRDLLGHRTIQMTERYAHLAPGYLQGAVDRVAVGQKMAD
ncbi:MAG: site-specific integrase [Candidatus Competibacterales bacterium]